MYARKQRLQLCVLCDLHYSGRGRGRPANHPPPPEYLLTQHRCKETSPPLLHTTTNNNTQQHTTTHNNTQQHTTTHNSTQQHTTTLHNSTRVYKTTNVPVVFMRLYLMVLRGATSLLGALEGVGPENLDFLGTNGTRFARAISGPKKVSIFRVHPFQCPE
jgi:hypothetical protein